MKIFDILRVGPCGKSYENLMFFQDLAHEKTKENYPTCQGFPTGKIFPCLQCLSKINKCEFDAARIQQVTTYIVTVYANNSSIKGSGKADVRSKLNIYKSSIRQGEVEW